MKKTEKRPFLNLGKNIAERRDRLGLNQDDFAEEIGVATTSLKNIERGVAEGQIETRLLIAEAFGCSLADLYREPKEPDFSGFSDAADFLATFANLPPKAQRFVIALVYGDPSLYASLPEKMTKELKGVLPKRRASS